MQDPIIYILLAVLFGFVGRQIFSLDKKIDRLQITVDKLESNRYLTYSVSISPHWYSILSYYLDKELEEETRNQIALAIEDLRNWDEEKEKKYINCLLGKHFSYTLFYSTDGKFSLLRDWAVKGPVEDTIKQGKILAGVISSDSLLYHLCEISFGYLGFSNQTWNEDVNKNTFLYTFPYSEISRLIRLNQDLLDKTDEIVSLAEHHGYTCLQDEINFNHFEFKNEFVTYSIGVTDMG